ncbi:MAG: CPBP family intramembrane glutamic endopeptidase [Chloroflexota bacterium]|nr:CPBP family intramembrane glutamic endopeptidase [Chloroflexota bacterium]
MSWVQIPHGSPYKSEFFPNIFLAGLRLGSPKIWGWHVVVVCTIAAIVLYASSFSSSLQSYYQEQNFDLLTYFWTSCISLAAWEFFYRGYLLFGLRERFKEGAILLQTIPFVLMHLGKPELETISTIFTGIIFGYVAYRGKSFWPAFIIHLFINIFFVSLINYRYPLPETAEKGCIQPYPFKAAANFLLTAWVETLQEPFYFKTNLFSPPFSPSISL